MNIRITFLTNYNEYESKRYFTDKLIIALEKLGVLTQLIDMKEQELDEESGRDLLLFQPDCTFSFNSFVPSADNRYLWDLIKTPHIAALLDPVVYSLNLTSSPYCHLTSVDRSDCRFLEEADFPRFLFWPHAVESDLEPNDKEKVYPVAFLGSCYDYKNLALDWQKRYPPFISRIIEDAVDIVLSGSYSSLVEAFISAWNQANLPSTSSINFNEIFFYFDYYLRGLDRISLIQSIQNVPVHIFGTLSKDHPSFTDGWESYLGGQSNVTIHPPVPFHEALEIQKQCRITLNSAPFFKNGSHERVFTSLACGAVPVTNDSNYLQECFSNDEVIFYSPGKWEGVEEKIITLLNDEPKRQAASDKGRKKVMQNHTWDQRAAQLLEYLVRYKDS